MAGFIDVTGWSSRDIQRLGHEDDDTQPTKRVVKSKKPIEGDTCSLTTGSIGDITARDGFTTNFKYTKIENKKIYFDFNNRCI